MLQIEAFTFIGARVAAERITLPLRMHPPSGPRESPRGDLVEEVGRLKERAGAPTLVAGSATLVHALVEQDPVDEYRAMVFPVPIADGVWTGPGTSDRKPLRLLHVETFASGVVVLACEAEPCP